MRSIMAAKPLLEEGFIWRIGNGLSTKIWTDKWLPIPTSYRAQSEIQNLNAEEKVAELIDPDTKAWKVQLINVIFSKEEVGTIHKIPRSLCNIPDKLTWKCAMDGHFSVKSAYHLQNEIQQRSNKQSSSKQNKEKWRHLWKLEIPNAEKLFQWKACNDLLPTK